MVFEFTPHIIHAGERGSLLSTKYTLSSTKTASDTWFINISKICQKKSLTNLIKSGIIS